MHNATMFMLQLHSLVSFPFGEGQVYSRLPTGRQLGSWEQDILRVTAGEEFLEWHERF